MATKDTQLVEDTRRRVSELQTEGKDGELIAWVEFAAKFNERVGENGRPAFTWAVDAVRERLRSACELGVVRASGIPRDRGSRRPVPGSDFIGAELWHGQGLALNRITGTAEPSLWLELRFVASDVRALPEAGTEIRGRVSRFYETESGAYRSTIENVDDSGWMSPTEAEELLLAGRAQTPFPLREYLCWRAANGLLPSKTTEIINVFADGSQEVFPEMPLGEEWKTPAWAAPHADLWKTAKMRIARQVNGCAVITEFRAIAFERLGIEEVLSMYQVSGAVSPLPTGDPGRPTKGRQFYLAEFDRRAAAGLVLPKIREEALALQQWFKQEHPLANQPSPGAIENNIRAKWQKIGFIPRK